jgi:hypothetical protein
VHPVRAKRRLGARDSMIELNSRPRTPSTFQASSTRSPESSTIEIHVRPRRGSKPVCSGCHKPAAGYDQLERDPVEGD